MGEGTPDETANSLPDGDCQHFLKEEDLETFNAVGTGSTAVVYEGTWKGEKVAIKRINNTLVANRKQLLAYSREVSVMTITKCEHLVAFYGVVHSPKRFDIVMEYCAGGDCFELLHNSVEFDLAWEQSIKLLIDVAKGMNYLHNFDPQIIHRDLKSMNVLLQSRIDERTLPWAKVSDFGLSKMKEAVSGQWEGKMTRVGTGAWMAPEVYREKYDEKADVYSFAMFMYEVICQEIPFESSGVEPIVCLDGTRPDLNQVPEDCPPELKVLMEKCWVHNPVERPSFESILNDMKSLDG